MSTQVPALDEDTGQAQVQRLQPEAAHVAKVQASEQRGEKHKGQKYPARS